MSLAIIWLIVLVVCLVVEISTLGLTSIWFAGGALLALLIAMIGIAMYTKTNGNMPL